MFGADPAGDLDRAEDFLARGHAVRALEIAQKVQKKKHPAVAVRADELVARCQDQVVANAVERSQAAEQAGDLEDAADWLRAALERVRDATQRSDLEARLRGVLERLEAEEVERPEPLSVESDEPDPAHHAWDLESHYFSLIDTLVPEMAERYEDRPVELQQAVVDLNEGRSEEALAALDALVAISGDDDPVPRFERGRSRLATGDSQGAREDFEAVWPVLGDDHLDLGGSLSVPTLWAEAALAVGDPHAVADRLGPRVNPLAHDDDPREIELLGEAYLALERYDDARKLLAPAAANFPRYGAFLHLLGQSLVHLGEPKLAIHALETAIVPACASGRCTGPALHAPALRLLASLHLDQEPHKKQERVEELLAYSAQAQGGRWMKDDFELLARLHDVRGQEAAAQAARDKARQLERAGAQAMPVGTPDLGGKEAIL